MRTLQEYLTPDPWLRGPLPSPETVTLTRPSRQSRTFSLRDKGSSRGAIVANGFKTVFESKLEYWAGLVYLARHDVEDLEDQPPAVEFVDDDGELCGHTFDYRVTRTDLSRVALVVKPSALVARSGIERTIELLAEQMSPRFAGHIKLVTEKSFTLDDRFNAELIDSAKRRPDPKDDAVVAALIGKLRGETRVGDLVEATGKHGYGFRAVVRAIADGRLMLTERVAIDEDTVVRRRRKAAS